MARVVACLMLGLVAACSVMSVVRARSADIGGVTYEFPAGRLDEVTRQAKLYCANLGRSAELASTTRESDDRAVATYDCR